MKRTGGLRDRLFHLLLLASLTLASGPALAATAPNVRICHFPPGNPADVEILSVGAAAVPAHLTQHNDAACPAGASDCCFGGGSAASTCTDLENDPANCGTCGNACPAGTTCSDGACGCPAGTLLCNGACIDPQTDPTNCGACGTACATDGTCASGLCTCPDGRIPCGGVCVDDDTDPQNCGECGNECPAGTTCAAGSCTESCAPGTTLCGGVCVDEQTDPNNCGTCGNACAAGSACTNGSCTGSCPPGTTLCAGVCVNENTDPANCGVCGNACAAGSNCAAGACQSACPDGNALCGDMCVNQNTDPNHCGSCGTVCGAGTTCTGGNCVATGVAGSCLPSSSLGVLIQGTAVTAYVPLGSWSEMTSGIIVVPLEPPGGAPTVVPTVGPVNSCSSNGSTGLTVCTGNSNDVYLLHGTTVLTTLAAGGTGVQSFSGGDCVTCGVATDASTGLAWLAEGTGGAIMLAPGQLQSLNPTTSVFAPPIDLFGVMTSENISVDPVRHLILSAVEDGNFQIIDTTTGSVFNSVSNFGLMLNATAEDCSTGIAVAPGEFSSSILFVDLSQAAYTPGAPGTWSAPALAQDFGPEFMFPMAGLSGIAVAPGSHLAGVTDEFLGPAFGVVELPATSGVGIPSAVDYVAASMPDPALGLAWNMGLDPHTMTAYSSPNTGRAILAISNVERTYLALVDMQALLGAPRTVGTHTVDPSVDLVGSGIVTFVAE